MPFRAETSLMASAIICDRLDGRMKSKLFHPTGLEGVDPAILPDIGAVAAMLAELKAVDMRSRAILEGEDQFMPGAIEGPHAAIVLGPDNKILEFGIGGLARL